MTRPTVLRRVKLGLGHRPTGATRHYFGNVELPPPVELRIAQYVGEDDGFYLFYCDETGREQADTYHHSLDAAMQQAQFEFGVKQDEWELVKATAR
jgi:hypothetical protein